MALTLRAPQNSFVQFSESDLVTSCEFSDRRMCLPVFAASDVAWQFLIDAESEAEADGLCDMTNELIEIGVTDDCDHDLMVTFPWKPSRQRVGTRTVAYNCSAGLTDFDTVIDIGNCFVIKIIVNGIYGTQEFCSNCFQRIGEVCHTSVLDYGNDDNAFGFSYCAGTDGSAGSGGSGGGGGSSEDCEPTFITFTNQTSLTIPYTTSLQDKYGTAPSVTVWIFDEDLGVYVNPGLSIKQDGFPPTNILIDLGGSASGYVKIK